MLPPSAEVSISHICYRPPLLRLLVLVLVLLLGAGAAAAAGDATRIGRTLASRLKELLDRQQYEVIIQVRDFEFLADQQTNRPTGDEEAKAASSVYSSNSLFFEVNSLAQADAECQDCIWSENANSSTLLPACSACSLVLHRPPHMYSMMFLVQCATTDV
jgi:hypothetical protein